MFVIPPVARSLHRAEINSMRTLEGAAILQDARFRRALRTRSEAMALHKKADLMVRSGPQGPRLEPWLEPSAVPPSRLAPARDHIELVVEPQRAVFLQHLGGGLRVAGVVGCLGQAVVLDLRDIDRGVPGREQRRGADRACVISPAACACRSGTASVVGVGVEVQLAPGRPSSCFTAFMIWWRSCMNGCRWPDLLNDFEPGSLPCDWMAISRPPGPSAPAARSLAWP